MADPEVQELSTIPTMQSYATPQQKPIYIPTTPLLHALDWLLSNPSIPLSMRKQFYMLWENVIFGNYEKKDMLLLMSKFREWCILLKWYIPEQQWGNTQQFMDDNNTDKLSFDLNALLNMLEQLYYIQLTRGKAGFTVTELTTMRNVLKSEEEKTKKREIRLF